MKLAVLHPGSRMGYAIPVMLWRTGLLSSVYTDLFLHNNSLLEKLLSQGLLPSGFCEKYLRSRMSMNIDSGCVKSMNLTGLKLFMRRRKAKNLFERLKLEYSMTDALCRRMLLDTDEFDTVYSFISASQELFASLPSKTKILDVMHPPHQYLIPRLREEASNFAEWQDYQDPYVKDAENILVERESYELEQADIILSPSKFVLGVLKDVLPDKKTNVLYSPYPLPLWVNSYTHGAFLEAKQQTKTKLRLLFVGSVTLRKGIQYLLPAVKELEKLDIELHVVGKLNINPKKISEYADVCQFKGFMSKSELSAEYKWADVFVFPSIAEGSAGVIYEAMSFGLPIITTYAAGSVVRDSIDGFVIQQLSTENLIDKISSLYFNRSLLEEMSVNVIERIDRFNVENLSGELSALLKENISV